MELITRMTVRPSAKNGSPWRLNLSASSGGTVGGAGGQGTVEARTLKYAANRPEKNMTSEQMKRSIPRIGLLIPPRVSWAKPAVGLWSLTEWPGSPVVNTWDGVVTIGIHSSFLRRSMPRPPVAEVEQRPFGADLRKVVEVVGRRRRARRPF